MGSRPAEIAKPDIAIAKEKEGPGMSRNNDYIL